MCVCGCCAAPAQVDKILDSFYEYMDDRDRWQEAGVVKVCWPPAAGPDLRQLRVTAPAVLNAPAALNGHGLAVTRQAAGLGQHAQVDGTDRVSRTGALLQGKHCLVAPPSCDPTLLTCCHVGACLQNFLAALGAGGAQHPYPIYASLLRHACQHKLAIADCAAVLQVAKDQVGCWVHTPQWAHCFALSNNESL